MRTITLSLGDIIDATVPFTDADGRKRRPVVVLGWTDPQDRNRDRNILVLPITSFGGGTSPTKDDIRVSVTSSMTVSPESYIRSARLMSIRPSATFPACHRGALTDDDLLAAITRVTHLFSSPNSAKFESTYFSQN